MFRNFSFKFHPMQLPENEKVLHNWNDLVILTSDRILFTTRKWYRKQAGEIELAQISWYEKNSLPARGLLPVVPILFLAGFIGMALQLELQAMLAVSASVSFLVLAYIFRRKVLTVASGNRRTHIPLQKIGNQELMILLQRLEELRSEAWLKNVKKKNTGAITMPADKTDEAPVYPKQSSGSQFLFA